MLQCAVVDVNAQHASGVGSIAFVRFDSFGLEAKGLEQVNKLTTARTNVEALFGLATFGRIEPCAVFSQPLPTLLRIAACPQDVPKCRLHRRFVGLPILGGIPIGQFLVGGQWINSA